MRRAKWRNNATTIGSGVYADVVPPRGSVAARVVVDMSEEREFVGRLGIPVRGSMPSSEAMIRFLVKLRVEAPSVGTSEPTARP